MLFLRYEHEGNRKVEGTIVKEVRGNFGKDKWEKAEIKVAVHQYWRSLRDDAVRKVNGKLEEHRIATRRRQRVQRKLSHRFEMVDKANLPAQDREKARALLNMDNALDFMSSEESDNDEGQTTGPPSRHIKPLKWERSKLRNIKALLDATHKARMSKRQHRTSAKITRVLDQNLSSRPLPQNCPSWAGRLNQS